MSGMNVTSESTAEKRRCRSWNCVNCRRRRVEQSRARRVEVLESGHHQATNRTAIRADVDWVGCRKCSTFAPFAILAPLRKSPSPVLDPNPELRLISNPYPIPNSVINNRAVVVTYGSCYLSDIRAYTQPADAASWIVVRHSEGPPQRGDSTGAIKNAGFNAKLQRNLGLDFATKQHKSLQKLQPVYSFVYWHVNSCLLPPFRYRGPSLGRADTASKACIINSQNTFLFSSRVSWPAL